MKYGLAFANTMSFTGAAGARELAVAAEAAGFESLWTVEHVVYPDGYESSYPYAPSGRMAMASDTPLPDPLIWLTWVAAATQRIRLATGILILPQRNPLVLAKEVATLDALSGGRVELGVGVGWLREEFDALGIEWERRGARTDEYVAVMRALWAGDSVSFEGDFTSFTGISSNPKPVAGSVPIVIGGHSPAAARRAGRIGDGFFPAGGDVAELVDMAQQEAAAHGRDPAALEVSTPAPERLASDPVGAAQEMRAAGVDRLMLPAFLFLGDPATSLAATGETIVAPTAAI